MRHAPLRRAPKLAMFVALLMSGCAAPDEFGQIEQATRFCPTGPTLNGVDVSHGNGTINWGSVHGASYVFAIMKATQGMGYTDSQFHANWSGAQAAGVVRGAYHFFDPTVDGVAQANHFLAVMGTLAPGDLPPMLDLECPDGSSMCLGYAGGTGNAPAATIRARVLDWLHTVQAATGRTPMIYTFPSYFSGSGVDTTGFDAYPLFIANLSTTACYTIPSPWTTALIRQYDWTGTVPGISGSVDRDYFYGTLADLTGVGADAGPPPTDAGVPDVSTVDVPATVDAGTPLSDSGGASDAGLADAGSPDGAITDASGDRGAGGDGGAPTGTGGCKCSVPGHRTPGPRAYLFAVIAVGVLLRGRRRRG